jgi:ribosome-associated heat shock protein Hsp15
MSALEGSVRVDRWLCAARIYKSRTSAQDACAASHVKVNSKNVRSSHLIKVGDRIDARAPRGDAILVVLALAEKRLSPPQARDLYEDHSPPPPEREERVALRERGMGRPTKVDRRRMERFRGGF